MTPRFAAFRPPLWIKVWLLLGVNFALLFSLGAGWFLTRDQQGWERLALGPLGDRVAALADQIAAELWLAEPDAANRLLAEHAAGHGVEFIWMRNDGLVLAGPARPLPPPVAEELARKEGVRSGPPGPERVTARGVQAGPGRGEGSPGRLLFRDPEGTYWFGVRLHPTPAALEASRPPPRTTLIIRTESSWQFAKLLGLHDWVGGAGLALGISVLFWLPFVRSVTRRLDELTRATDRIAEGDFQIRTQVSGADEIGRLGGSINSLAARLASHTETQKRFLGDVAHELASPIGRLQVAVELLEQRAGPGGREAVADVREDVQAMAELVNELLAFTRAGLRSRAAELRPVSVEALVAAVLAREDAGRQVRVEVTAGLAVQADAALLQRAVGNLLRNALRYGGGRPVTLRAAEISGGQVEIVVEDEGPGVPAEALPRLGEPFFRPEEARARESGGVGLGLTIVRSAAVACGGEIHFANRSPRGFAATLRLAAAR